MKSESKKVGQVHLSLSGGSEMSGEDVSDERTPDMPKKKM
jgi:hypothetical protein